MPSLLHEGIVALVRERPEFAADLLRDVLHVPVPPFTSARLAEATLNELVPTEYHADAVVLLVDRAPVFGIILEAQLREDPDKPFIWPMYAVSARARHRCPFVVLVVTPDASTARWATTPVDLGGGNWCPLVVGPTGVPVITDVEVALRDPHLAVLSAMAHGRDDDARTAAAVAAASAGLADLPEPMRVLCSLLIQASLGEAARKLLAMPIQVRDFVGEYKRQVAAEAMAVGLAEGKAEGKASGKAQALLLVLEGRGLPLTADERARILACTDTATLDGWLRRAAAAPSAADLLA